MQEKPLPDAAWSTVKTPLGCAQNRDPGRTQPESGHVSKVAGQRAFVVIIHLLNVCVSQTLRIQTAKVLPLSSSGEGN